MKVWHHWLVALGLLALALAIRVPMAGTYQTTDEPAWMGRSVSFARAILDAEYTCLPERKGRTYPTESWGCTFQTAHPGVTTMMLGSIGLWWHYQLNPAAESFLAYLQTIDTTNLSLFQTMHVPFALAASLYFPVFYALLYRLLRRALPSDGWLQPGPLAVTATLLLVLDPFHVAHSRVLHHDNLTMMFMSLALLPLIGYWFQQWHWGWLVTSGVLAGMALLSKIIALFMLPFAAVVGGVALLYRRDFTGRGVMRLAVEGIGWGIVVMLAFAVFFPAMWSDPVRVFSEIFLGNADMALEGHRHFFLGQATLDPGPLYYPLMWLWRASPLHIIGLLALLPVGWMAYKHGRWRESVFVVFMLYVVLLLVFVSYSPKKQDRYFLPAYPVIDIFVAMGLLWLTNTLIKTRASLRLGALLGVIVVVQGGLIWYHAPYYLTYYNPLLGGPAQAAESVTLGWGEGLDQAAAYLNQQPDAESVAVFDENINGLRLYFNGNALGAAPPHIFEADYVVFARNVVQRLSLLPDYLTAWHYTKQQYKLVHTVTLYGADYAYIFRNPNPGTATLDPIPNQHPNRLATLGYRLTGDAIQVYWADIQPPQQLHGGLALPLTSKITWQSCMTQFGDDTARLDACPLAPPDEGIYRLYVGVQSPGTEIVPLNAAGLEFVAWDGLTLTPIEADVALDALARQQVPDGVAPLDLSFSGARLVGYQLQPDPWQAGETGRVVLYWQNSQQPDYGIIQGYEIALLLSQDTAQVAMAQQPILPPELRRLDPVPGSITPVEYPLEVTALPGDYRLDVCLTETVSQTPVECLTVPVRVVE